MGRTVRCKGLTGSRPSLANSTEMDFADSCFHEIEESCIQCSEPEILPGVRIGIFPYFFWGNHVAPLSFPSSPLCLHSFLSPGNRIGKFFARMCCAKQRNSGLHEKSKNFSLHHEILTNVPVGSRLMTESDLNAGERCKWAEVGKAPSPHRMANVQY